MTYTIVVCRVKNSDEEQRNCPNYVESYYTNKFEKFLYPVGSIIRNHYDARSLERQKIN